MAPNPFDDLDDYLALPRVTGLASSPDGRRAVIAIAELNNKRTEYVTALWEIDPAAARPMRRLTRGTTGESAPVFTADGDLLFTASRPDGDEDKPPAALWRLPRTGGEAECLQMMPGGVSAAYAARAADTVVISAPMLAAAAGVADDKRLRALRKDNAVTAILHTGYPVRYWDHDLGPGAPHLLRLGAEPVDLTAVPGPALREAHTDIAPDGEFLITSWRLAAPGAAQRSVLMRIHTRTGERRVVADDPQADLGSPVISPDGTRVAFVRETISTPLAAPEMTLCCLTFGDRTQTIAANWDRWPESVAWERDGSALIVTADDGGRRPVFRITLDGAVDRLTVDDWCYTDIAPVPGGAILALRSSYAAPPHPVRIEADGSVTVIPSVDIPALPGRLDDVRTQTTDGQTVRSWLVSPDTDDPAPLLLWIHGGPLGSWNMWSWRWNPWLLAAAGYAVLLPDPALSTGYGQEFIQRGWGSWGGAPFTDLMAATDAACALPGIDAGRIAAMGGSFGGYMANWVAGHTDRFAAIVTHASLWALDQFGPTTDSAYYWAREMTPQMAQANSPHRFVADIRTPMLVIHGDRDYRVPICEGLRLWYELLSSSGLPADGDGRSPHRFLYFPSENHWVLTPQHAKLWYQVVTAFLAEHVLGETPRYPEALG